MLIGEIANFVHKTNYNSIPLSVMNKTKLCLLDYLASATGGYCEKSTQIALETINEFSKSHGKSIVLDFSKEYKLSSLDAAFLNGIAAHSKDLDDGHRYAYMHPGASVFSSALALSQELDSSSKDLLTSVVCGYEVAVVLGMLFNPQHRNNSFHSTGTIGVFASASSCSYLLNLNKKQIINALGIAGTQASGLLESDHSGSMAKHIHPGSAARIGVLSALLSKKGFTGAENILQGEDGFIRAMVGSLDLDYLLSENELNLDNYFSDEIREKNILKSFLNTNLGYFHIKDVYLKSYPVCRHIHSTIDAYFYILEQIKDLNLESKFKIDCIQEIKVNTYKIAADHDNYNPKSKEDIRQSLPYSLAISILKGSLDSEYLDNLCNYILFKNKENILENHNFEPKDISKWESDIHSIQNIVNKITLNVDYDLDKLQPNKRPAHLKIIFKAGAIKQSQVDLGFKPLIFKNNIDSVEKEKKANFIDGKLELESLVYLPKGESENPFSKEDILHKYKSLNPKIKDNKLNIIQNTIDNLEQYTVNEFIDILK